MFVWSFFVIFAALTMLLLFFDGWANHQAGGTPPPAATNWYVAISVIGVISALLSFVVVGVAAVFS